MKVTAPKDKDDKRGSVLRQISELDRLSFADLQERWRVLNGTEPPRYNRQFIVKRLAFRIQELAYGGLNQEDRDRMARVIDDSGYDGTGLRQAAKKPRPASKDGRFIPGTLLIREWGNERHEVRVLDVGFEYRGMFYRSLSALARLITGTQWSGPAFFGLRSDKEGDDHGSK